MSVPWISAFFPNLRRNCLIFLLVVVIFALGVVVGMLLLPLCR